LADDRTTTNGGEFDGELVPFGSDPLRTWEAVTPDPGSHARARQNDRSGLPTVPSRCSTVAVWLTQEILPVEHPEPWNYVGWSAAAAVFPELAPSAPPGGPGTRPAATQQTDV
jgi:hypothetical protein